MQEDKPANAPERKAGAWLFAAHSARWPDIACAAPSSSSSLCGPSSSNPTAHALPSCPALPDCPGTSSDQAGTAAACAGCPNQAVCASAPKGPDPGKGGGGVWGGRQ